MLGCLTLLIAFLLKKYEDYKIKNLTNNNIPVLSKSSGQLTQKSELNIDIINNIPVTGETVINNGDTSQIEYKKNPVDNNKSNSISNSGMSPSNSQGKDLNKN